MKELIKKSWDYTLSKDKEKLILNVLCGTIGMFEILIELDKAEIKYYNERGEGFIDELAKKIQSNPESYTKRNITNLS